MTTAPTASEPYSMPAQIQRQGEAMDAFDAGVLADQAAAAAAEAAPTPPAVIAPAPEPVVPATTATPPPAPEPWEQRYRSLQGVFDRQAAELVALTAKVNAMAAPQPEPKAPKPSVVTAADTEAFGGDLVDLIKRQATEIAQELVGPTEAKLAEALAENAKLKGQIEGVAGRQQKSDGDTYIAEFAKVIPHWETQNVDPAFLAWLAEADPVSGIVRQEYMTKAVGDFNVKQTVALFKAWPGYAAAPSPVSPPPPPAPPAPKPSVTPPSTKVDATPTTPTSDAQVWTTSEIQSFYDDCGRGKYRGNEAEQARIEASIDAAVQSNRVKP